LTEVKKFKADLKKFILQRFQHIFQLEEYLLATFLDPRFITKCFLPEKLEEIKQLGKSCFTICSKENLIDFKKYLDVEPKKKV
jgi:hypothetical protein